MVRKKRLRDYENVDVKDESLEAFSDGEPEITLAPEPVKPKKVYKVNAAQLNVREEPSYTSKVLRRVVLGDVLDVVEKKDNSWGRLSDGGWVALRYCTF